MFLFQGSKAVLRDKVLLAVTSKDEVFKKVEGILVRAGMAKGAAHSVSNDVYDLCVSCRTAKFSQSQAAIIVSISVPGIIGKYSTGKQPGPPAILLAQDAASKILGEVYAPVSMNIMKRSFTMSGDSIFIKPEPASKPK